jgi:hypothetical protein
LLRLAADGVLTDQEAEPVGPAVPADEAAGAEVDVIVGEDARGLHRARGGEKIRVRQPADVISSGV